MPPLADRERGGDATDPAAGDQNPEITPPHEFLGLSLRPNQSDWHS
jgi:hypothetical protein